MPEDGGHIFLASPHMSAEGYERQYIDMAFQKNFIAPLGENVDGLEKELCAKVGAGAGAALSSGTAAIHMALKAVGVGPGDIVFCQSLTFSATANPIRYLGAAPVFIDSDKETWNMSPDALERAFRKYPKVKAVLVVHLYGMAADLDSILTLCEERGVPLIEDAAESLGTTYKGRYTGTFGTAAIFSFNGNKIITTSGGGMLVWNKPFGGKTPDEKTAKVRFWATQARDKARHYQHSEIGYNYRMSNISAGIGRGQLKALDLRIRQKQYIYRYYQNAFADLDGIEMMPLHDWESSNCWLSVVQLTGKVKPLEVIEALEKADAEARPVWKPMHLQPVFSGCDYIDNGNISEGLFTGGVCLPSDTKMSDDDLARVCRAVCRLWEGV